MRRSELIHIISESIKKQLLNEISIRDKYKKEQGRTKWNADDFQLICQSDPTYNMDKDIVGKYTNWLLNKLNSIEQLQQVRIPLEWYADGMKRGILQRIGVPTDINKFKTINEFIETMNSVMHGDNNNQMSQSEYNNRKKLDGQFEIVGENADYEVIVPKTFVAERYFGSGTEWCTVANELYFDFYIKKGNLYIFYPKNGDKKLKMQFHIESNSYATYDDKVYDTPSKCVRMLYSGNEDKINTTLALCQKVFKDKISEALMINVTFDKVQALLDKGYEPDDIFDYVEYFINGYKVVRLNDKFNWISKDNRLVSHEKWFDSVYNFTQNGYANGWINETKYIVDTNGNVYYVTLDNAHELLYKGFGHNVIFDDVYDFVNGYAMVQLNDKWNWISKDNRLVSHEQWYDWCDDFNKNGYAKSKIDNKTYNIDTNGQILEEITFDNVHELLDKGYSPNYIFDYIYGFVNSYACVRLNRKYNWISRDFRLVSPYQWFDRVNHFNEKGYALAMIGDTKYIVDTNGQLFDYHTNQPINSQNSTNMALNELKHIIRESIKRQLNKQ